MSRGQMSRGQMYRGRGGRFPSRFPSIQPSRGRGRGGFVSNEWSFMVDSSKKIGSITKDERTKARGNESADKNTKQNSSGSSSVSKERVLKAVGSTSTSFIGPVGPPCRPEKVPRCRPKTVPPSRPETVPSPKKPKTDIEDTLSEFYKELEKIDSVDEDTSQPSRHVTTPMLHASLEKNGNMNRSSDTDHRIEQKQPSWPLWDQNQPYGQSRPRSDMDLISGRPGPPQDHWRHPPPFQRPPFPRFQRPPYGHPPPPFAFPNPQHLFQHMNQDQDWRGSGRTDQYQEEVHFPPDGSLRFPPPTRDRQGCNYDTEPGVHVDWSANAHGGSQQDSDWRQRANAENHNQNKFIPDLHGQRVQQQPADKTHGECQHDSDWRQRTDADAENDLREHRDVDERDQHQPADKAHVHDHDSSLVLILMRGLPGSGKSTRAKELLSTGPSGLILSTDDYFAQKNGYVYDLNLLGAAHEWNHSRAKEAMHEGRSPVIIDNTNIQAWEMKPYVQMAMEKKYTVYFHEPDTRWKFDPLELEKLNKHGVPQEKIAQMMDRFSSPISVDIVLSSQEPQHVNARHRPEQWPMRGDKPHFC